MTLPYVSGNRTELGGGKGRDEISRKGRDGRSGKGWTEDRVRGGIGDQVEGGRGLEIMRDQILGPLTFEQLIRKISHPM